MNLSYKHLLSAELPPQSRVWIYQSNRLFSMNEALAIEDILNDFVNKWKSHGADVKGAAHLLFGQFIVLMADNTEEALCGSTMDSSLRLIKEIEKQFNVMVQYKYFAFNKYCDLLFFLILLFLFYYNFISQSSD